MKTNTETYYVQVAGWVLGEERRKGAEVQATKEEVKFLLLNGTLGKEKPLTVAEQRAIDDRANGVSETPVIAPDDEIDHIPEIAEAPVEDSTASPEAEESSARRRRG